MSGNFAQALVKVLAFIVVLGVPPPTAATPTRSGAKCKSTKWVTKHKSRSTVPHDFIDQPLIAWPE